MGAGTSTRTTSLSEQPVVPPKSAHLQLRLYQLRQFACGDHPIPQAGVVRTAEPVDIKRWFWQCSGGCGTLRAGVFCSHFGMGCSIREPVCFLPHCAVW